MVSPATSFTKVEHKWIGLLLLAVASIHCQVRNSGLSGAVGDTLAPGSGGSPAGDPDAEQTGGQGPDTTSGAGGAQGAPDLRLENDLAGTGGGSGQIGLDSGAGAAGGGGIVALDGGISTGGMPAQGGAVGSGGGGAGTGSGGSGGATGLGGSLDAEDTAVDSEPPDAPSAGDVVLIDWDAGMEDAVVADAEPDVESVAGDDAASDVTGMPDDVAEAPAPGTPDAADGMSGDTGPALTLLWEDNFDGDANSGVDTTKWSYVTWPAGQVNNEAQRYADSRQNVFLDGHGYLYLRGLRSATEYTSGRIETKAQFKFGRIEVSAKLPAGQGSFPGIVMLGSGGWPQSGEIGLMEQHGQPDEKSWFYASAYADTSANSGNKRNIQYDFPNDTTASSGFHVYSVDWYTDHLVFQIDGDEVMRTSFGTSSPFYTTSERLVLDLALGGDMGGTIDPSAFQAGTMDMVVDYVRVYAF